MQYYENPTPEQTKVWKKHRNRVITTIFLVFLIIFILVDTLSPIGGQIRFYAKWIECGQLPYEQRGSGYFNEKSPHYVRSSLGTIIRTHKTYYCTPKEAEMAGYSASSHEAVFPHLTEQEEREMWKRRWSDSLR